MTTSYSEEVLGRGKEGMQEWATWKRAKVTGSVVVKQHK